MTGWFEEDELRFLGLNDQQLAQLSAAWPAINTAVTALKPHLTNLAGIIQTLVRKQQELKS